MATKRKHEDEQSSKNIDLKNESLDTTIHQSNPIHDRSSIFIGFFSVDASIADLRTHPGTKNASHKITASRRPSKQKGLVLHSATTTPARILYDTNCDDDGEKYAGKKVEKVLIEMNVRGTILVARWYGGVMLGPVRFEHITNVAREAVEKWRMANQGSGMKRVKFEQGGVDAGRKVISAEEEAQVHERLVKHLEDRDGNIAVLRDLLVQRKVGVEETNMVASQSSVPSQNKNVVKMEYASMSLEKLRVLEKARDSTISWILKQIDELEPSKKGELDESKKAG